MTSEKSIRPCDATKRPLPTDVNNNELKITTSGLNMEPLKHIEASTANNLDTVKTIRNIWNKVWHKAMVIGY